MTRIYNPPVVIQIYLGSGKEGIKLRDNLLKMVKKNKSLSETVLGLFKKAEPSLFKGVDPISPRSGRRD